MMNPLLDYFDPEELLEMLRVCANRLLIAYGETLQNELYVASERAIEACQSLLPLLQSRQHHNPITLH